MKYSQNLFAISIGSVIVTSCNLNDEGYSGLVLHLLSLIGFQVNFKLFLAFPNFQL